MDMAEQQQLQDRLALMESSLTRLLNHLPGLAYRCTVDKDYQYTMSFVSKGCERLIGFSQKEILAHPTNVIENLTIEEDLARLRKAVYEAVVARRSYEVYYRIRLSANEIKWIWDQGDGVYDKDGNCLYLDGILMDVTAQKEKEHRLRKENRRLRASPIHDSGFGRVIGNSPAMQRVYNLATRAAKSDTNVILYGETGVGKDLIAKTIHDISSVKGKFIPVNCGAIPEQLLESEFFGHTKGAFSGATSNRAGYLAAADNGTLFLDEVGELPLNLQVKLLRALESRTYTPVGSSEARSSRFRLICATNRDLKDMVRQKTMREDFFYRIHVLTIHVPPLRERKQDIPLLASAYATAKGMQADLPHHIIASLLEHDWAGNVRELHNTLERYWVFRDLGLEEKKAPGKEVTPRPLMQGVLADTVAQAPDEEDYPSCPINLPYFPHNDAPLANGTQGSMAQGSLPANQLPIDPGTPRELSQAREETEKQEIINMLVRHGWKKGKTAEALGVTPRTLQRKLKKYEIKK